MIGYVAHPLFLRIITSGCETFVDLVRLVRRELFEAQRNTDCGRLLLQVPHLLSGGLFQWLPSQEGPLEGIATWVDSPGELLPEELVLEGAAGVDFMESLESDIVMSFQESRRGLDGYVIYRVDLFNAATIRQLLEKLQSLVNHVAETPYAPISLFGESTAT
jgi:hypothetical protein